MSLPWTDRSRADEDERVFVVYSLRTHKEAKRIMLKGLVTFAASDEAIVLVRMIVSFLPETQLTIYYFFFVAAEHD